MKHSKQAAKVLAGFLFAASVLSVGAGAAQTGTVTTNSLRLRANPTTTSSILAVAAKGSAVDVVSQPTNGWYKVVYQNQTGYMSSAYISFDSSGEELYAQVQTSGSTLRVRSGPGTTYSILGSVYDGNALLITGQTDGWYQVFYNGRTGYLSADYVVVKSSAQVIPKVDPSAPLGEQIVQYAKTFLGYPYIYATAGPDSFDCSGLTCYVYHYFGYSLYRSSKDQANNGTPVEKENLQAGDLVFFSQDGSVISHVGLYMGDGKFIHASTSTTGVIVSDLNSSYYLQHYVTARRII